MVRPTPTGWRWISFRRPSTTSWRNRYCSVPIRSVYRARRCGIDRESSCRACRASSVIRAALENRGALIQGTRSRRGLPDCQSHRSRTPRTVTRRRRSLGRQRSTTPAPSSSGATPQNRWATTARDRTTFCRRPGSARFSSPLGVYDFQKRTSLIRVSPGGVEDSGAHRSDAGLRRRPAGTRPLRRVSHRRAERHSSHSPSAPRPP
jgi:hypothetical protein